MRTFVYRKSFPKKFEALGEKTSFLLSQEYQEKKTVDSIYDLVGESVNCGM